MLKTLSFLRFLSATTRVDFIFLLGAVLDGVVFELIGDLKRTESDVQPEIWLAVYFYLKAGWSSSFDQSYLKLAYDSTSADSLSLTSCNTFLLCVSFG